MELHLPFRQEKSNSDKFFPAPDVVPDGSSTSEEPNGLNFRKAWTVHTTKINCILGVSRAS